MSNAVRINARLLIIDPQNDFCDIPGAALPVTGANADMNRLALFLNRASDFITSITVTLDSHPSVAIERTTFWQCADGSSVEPFTEITEADVREGRFLPQHPEHLELALEYLRALEAGGRYRLMVWPVHCVLGTWGHNIHGTVANALSGWEFLHQKPVHKVLKGLNPFTEQYSAIQAEVPREDDPSTRTNHALIQHLREGDGPLFVAGEASSHCVAATMQHLMRDHFTPEECAQVILLSDCMSPVAGFEEKVEEFFRFAEGLGARVMTSEDAHTLLLDSKQKV